MSNYSSLKATINANVKANGNQEITGPVMNSVLNAMVDSLGAGYQYMGKAVPSTNPGTPDAKVFYLASDPGTYTNFNGLVVADGEVALLKWDSAWSKEVTGAATAAQVAQLGKETQKLFTKTKSQFVRLANAYVYWGNSLYHYNISGNYELYSIRADGVKAIYYKAYDNSAAEMFIGFFSGNRITIENRITDSCVRSVNGMKEGWITDIPSTTRFITYCNRIASGDGEFIVYYDELPTAPPKNAIYLDELLNTDTQNGNLRDNASYNDIRVCTKSVCSFPKQGMNLSVRFPIGLECYFWYSGDATSAYIDNTTTPRAADGDIIEFPKTATHFRIVFRTPNNAVLSADTLRALVDSGDIAFYTTDQEANVIDRNISKEVRVGSAKRNLTGLLDGMDSMFCFSHISDLHGDSERLKNFADYSDHSGVDAAFNSGDTVMYNAKDYGTFAVGIMQQYPTLPYLFCIGNHEVFELSGAAYSQGLFGDNIAPLVTDYGYLKAADTPADDCYYYVDFADKKIRVIVLNYYNGGISTGSLGQAQINWFIATLSSTPSGYGILVMQHSPEDKVVASAPYDTFRQKVRVTTYQENGFYVGDRPIMHIVDAFIGRTSYSGSYSDNGTTVTINADFSAITDDTIQFIAYIVGHRHEDWIGYYEHATHKQLSLGITAGIALYGHGSNKAFANQEDLPRGGEGVCQDAFNIYGIDRKHNVVKVVRIGADLTFDFVPREYMEIPYAD